NRFLAAGFEELMVEYERHDQDPVPEALAQARQNLREAEQALLNADLKLVCVRDAGGEHWDLTLEGPVALPAGVQAQAWPLSLKADNARSLPLPLSWNDLPTTRLTAFFAFRLTVAVDGADAVEWVRKLPVSGFPEGRVSQVLRLLIDSPERLIQFLKALRGHLK
ncbi:MAG: hypothetical protein IIC50_25355, partial [Planctomycetes bacterium]|nr:hypothetical protein [Planctomycetota bacterium]